MLISKTKLKTMQARRCMTTKDLLAAAGLTRIVLTRIDLGRTSPMTVGKLARALQCDPADILADVKED